MYWLPLLAGLLPLLSTHIGYLWAAALEYVQWCNLYWDSCTSVSKVGRQPPVTLLFRDGIISAAVLMAIFWWSARVALVALTQTVTRRSLVMVWLGVIGAIFLIQYCVALGEQPRVYRLFRHSGVMFGVGCTLAAQLLLVLELRRCPQVSVRLLRWLKWILWGYLLIGLLSQAGKWLAADEDARRIVRDAFEWWLFLLMNGWMIVCGTLWRRLQLTVVYDCR